MTTTKRHALAAALAVAGALAASAAQAAGSSCFWSSEYWAWKASDAKTINIRVGNNRFFRLDLAAPCHTLMAPNVHLITTIRGSNLICRGLDWDLKASEGGDAVEGCIVKTMTQLTPAEAAAIPAKFRP
jgi:hypothetical protein